MFTNNNSEWRCDYCDELFTGIETVQNVIWIKEGSCQTMHFCNYDHVAKYFACKHLNQV